MILLNILKNRYIIIFLYASILFTIYHFLSAAKKPETKTGSDTIDKASIKLEEYILQFDSLLTAKIEASNMVGVAIAVVHNDKIEFLKTYGVKKAGSKDSINENTVFRLASVSKGFAGVLASQLNEEGIISMDDKIIDYLPDFKLKDSINTHTLTIRHILSHSSGLVPHAYDNLVEANESFNEIMERLVEVDISAPPGVYYGYQNFIFSLIDTISAIATSKTYTQLLEEEIFIPFRMQHASTGFKEFKSNKNKALPHRRKNGKFKVQPINDRYYNTLPAAGVNASISDMAQYLLTLLGNDSIALSRNSIELIFTPQIRSYVRWKYFRHWEDVEEVHYALGWRIVEKEDKAIAYHGGFVNGYRAEIALCQGENLGIVFLTNSPSSVASESIPLFFRVYFESLNNPSLH